jgi:hypothetical protein
MDNVLCSEWIKRMKDAGFSGKFRAVDITGKIVVNGEIKKDSTIETVKVATSQESRRKIKDLFKDGS